MVVSGGVIFAGEGRKMLKGYGREERKKERRGGEIEGAGNR